MKLSELDCITYLEVDELPDISEAEEGIIYRIPKGNDSGLFCKCDEYVYDVNEKKFVELEKQVKLFIYILYPSIQIKEREVS